MVPLRRHDQPVGWHELDGVLQPGAMSYCAEILRFPEHGESVTVLAEGLTLMRMALELALNNPVCAHWVRVCHQVCPFPVCITD